MENEMNASIKEGNYDAVPRDFDDTHLLLNNTRDLMWSVDKNFEIITSNRAYNEKFKSGPVGGSTGGIDTLAIELNFLSYYERALKGEVFTEIENVDTPVESWLQFSFYPIRKDDEIIGVTCYSRDVTILKKEQHHFKLLESVVTNATDAILITEAYPLDDFGPKIVYVNDALVKMTGYTREEIIGKTPALLHGPRTDRGELACSIQSLKKLEACEIEIVNYKKNGEEFCLHITIAPITDSNGLPTHVISIGRDVTERLKNIQAIKEQNTKLKSIAWVQSHELRGPLARIMGLVDLLNRNSESKRDDARGELINYLKISTNEMDMVIHKIVEQSNEIPNV
jgi:PAS domain S-box-containing protein